MIRRYLRQGRVAARGDRSRNQRFEGTQTIHAIALCRHAITSPVDEEAELYVSDFSENPVAAKYRARVEHDRSEARRRYRDHLAAVFAQNSHAEPGALADAALDALTVWRYVDSGEPCRCGCHPRLSESDLHDYGFNCVCTRPPEERHRSFQRWLEDIRAFWHTPEGLRIKAAEEADEADLQTWLAAQERIVVGSHGGLFPEQWWGEVDGHNFYFRERHGDWRIELDLRPAGRFVRTIAGTNDDGTTRYQDRELDEGDVIAYGTTDVEAYGKTLVERAQFIVDKIRIHLSRQQCTLHLGDLSSLEAMLVAEIRWCPACGARLSAP